MHQKPGFPLKCTHLLGMAIGSLRRLLPQYQQELTDISVSRVTSGAHFPFGPQRSSLETFSGRQLVIQAPPLRLVWVKQVAPQYMGHFRRCQQGSGHVLGLHPA